MARALYLKVLLLKESKLHPCCSFYYSPEPKIVCCMLVIGYIVLQTFFTVSRWPQCIVWKLGFGVSWILAKNFWKSRAGVSRVYWIFLVQCSTTEIICTTEINCTAQWILAARHYLAINLGSPRNKEPRAHPVHRIFRADGGMLLQVSYI